MAFLWGASAQQSEFDTLIDKTTSDLLPSSTPLDLPSALHLSDLIRSSAVPPPYSVKQLLRRITHDNPNVQLLALALADVAVKNGGTPFNAQLAKAAHQGGVATDLELLASGRKTGGVNRDVQQRARELLQEWATAFRASGKADLKGSELVEAYDRLKRDKVEFPQLDQQASAAMVDSLSAPDWLDAPVCTRCRTPFTTFNRKHHCRNCGQVFDQQCSASVAALPHYGIVEPVRVCDACQRRIKEGRGAEAAKEAERERDRIRGETLKAVSATSGTAGGEGAAGGKSRKEQEDDDLRRAIEASLADSSSSGADNELRKPVPPPAPPIASGYNPAYPSSTSTSTSTAAAAAASGGKGEEDDPDLAAAIAASLRDLAPPASAPFLARTASGSSLAPAGAAGGEEGLTYAQLFPRSSYAESLGGYSATSSAPPQQAAKAFKLPSYDLPPYQLASLQSFVTQSSAPPGVFAAEGRRGYDQARELAPALERSVEDARRRRALLGEMEWKLGEAARLYGAGLTERAYHPTLSRAPSYAPPVPTVSSPSATYAPDPRYTYHAPAILTGQPLPAYAVPPSASASALPPAPLAVASPPVAPAQAQAQAQAYQQPHPAQQQQQPVPQPAGFYKPSHFPAVPQTQLPTGLQTLPAAPSGEPWRRREGAEEEESEEEEREEVKEAELIQL
ncbi:hypothetical protein JCM10207_002786 [Rhodosporidiobolus poonsookiae]